MDNVSELTDKELEELKNSIVREQKTRITLTTARDQSNSLAVEYSEAVGRKDGDVWIQPTGAHDAYPSGSVVTHAGKTWASTAPANTHEPGVSGWREITVDGTPAEWVQPSGAHDAYKSGERILYENEVWVSLTDGNVWSPGVYGAGWALENPPVVELDPPTDPELEEPIDPDPAVEFVQPTGGHDAYGLGDQVLFEGQVWESTIPANTYSPTAYPAGWTRIV